MIRLLLVVLAVGALYRIGKRLPAEAASARELIAEQRSRVARNMSVDHPEYLTRRLDLGLERWLAGLAVREGLDDIEQTVLAEGA